MTGKPNRQDEADHGPLLLSLPAAAKVLGVRLWTLRNLIWRGQLRVTQFPPNRTMFISRRALEKLIERHERTVDDVLPPVRRSGRKTSKGARR
jgi:hypothetical protein